MSDYDKGGHLPEPTPVTMGRTVIYTINAADADQINRRRTGTVQHLHAHRERNDGSQLHWGNTALAGDQYPLIVTRAWGGKDQTVNGQVLLDGNDTLWVCSVKHHPDHTEEGHWHWPERV